jgi:protein-disulfide isomerase
MSRRTLLAVSLAGAAIVAGSLIAALALGTGGGSKQPAAAPVDGSRVSSMLRGIPQHGATLGSPDAPVTLMEFADPQCPYCAQWAQVSLPTIVQRYVRTGKVQIVFNGLAFVGADSDTALRTAIAAGRQGRFWNVLELLFENQGAENSGWVSDSLLRSIAAAVPGLDAQRMLDERTSSTVERAVVDSESFARQAGVNSTPSFAVGQTGGSLRLVTVSTLAPSGLTPSLDAALGQ